MDITVRGLDELTRALDALTGKMRAAAVRGVTKAAKTVHRDAVRNAPRSPTQAQRNRNMKMHLTRKRGPNGEELLRGVSKNGKVFYRKRGRDPNSASRDMPGGLERSITMTVYPESYEAEVFVASNSEAGKYAGFIHDGTYNLGIGSVAKKSGGKAVGNKFIQRAVDDNADAVNAMIEQELKKVEL